MYASFIIHFTHGFDISLLRDIHIPTKYKYNTAGWFYFSIRMPLESKSGMFNIDKVNICLALCEFAYSIEILTVNFTICKFQTSAVL